MQLSIRYGAPLPAIVLRPYQERGIADLKAAIAAGHRKIVCTAPTGLGKTVFASRIISGAAGKRVLFVAHRTELLRQTKRQLARWGVEHVGIVRAKDPETDPSAPVQVASIATLVNRELPPADIVFIDECHRAMAASYMKLFAAYPNALHLGLTATPFRADGQGLGEVYDHLVVFGRPSEGIRDGFLCDPRVFAGPRQPDMAGCKTLGGDYREDDLERAMNRPKLVGDIVETWLQRSQRRRTVVFAVSVAHSKAICEMFQNEHVRAKHLDGTTPEDERSRMLIELEHGDIEVITNCGVLTEGWDQPAVKCAVLARPTKSCGLHLQMCGRILRPWADPETGEVIDALILDHAGNVDMHGFPQDDRIFSLTEGQKRETRPASKVCPQCFLTVKPNTNPCPECGYEWPKQRTENEVEHDASVALEERKRQGVVREVIDDPELAFYKKEVDRARLMGFKPGYAAAKFKEKYGRWPPWAWSQSTKAAFAKDDEWKWNLNFREEQRQARAAEQEINAAPAYTREEYTQDDDIPFGFGGQMRAFENTAVTKPQILRQLKEHARADAIVKGQYWDGGKGCAVGCTVHSGNHAAYETQFGIPQMLARLEDTIFEGLPNAKAKEWPILFMRAIHPGADLSRVGWQFLYWLLTDEKVNPGINHPLVRDAVKKCANVLVPLTKGKPVDRSAAAARSARSARSAAWAAWSAAESAVWSARAAEAAARAAEAAAESAVWSARAAEAAEAAAESAVWSARAAARARSAREASYTMMADRLIELLWETRA